MRYHGMVARPPSEADSYILQVMYSGEEPKVMFSGILRSGSLFRDVSDSVFRKRKGY